MKRIFHKIEELANHIKDYLNLQIDVLKLTAAAKISFVLAGIIAGAIAAMVFVLVIVFGSFAAAYALSGWIGLSYAGFLIVAMIYLFIGIIVWLTKDRLIRIPIMNSIIRQLFKRKPEDAKD
jgi:hypothetical protein